MRLSTRSTVVKRLIAAVVLVTYTASCTTTMSGEKAFDSFESCFASNLGLAAVGGVGVNYLGKKLTERLTGSATAARHVGAAAGVATAALIAVTAWKKCGAVYNTSTAVAPPQPLKPQEAGARRAGLAFGQLAVKMDGSENDPPKIEFDFDFIATDAAAKDIPAKFRHKVEIVRFKAGDNDQLILADANGNALNDANGNPIGLDQAHKLPREKLHWITIAEEGRDDYVEDVVIQQGNKHAYNHKLQVPPRDKLPLPLPVPMRYTLTIEAGGQIAKRSVDFALLETARRPKTFLAAGAPVEPAAAPVARNLAEPGEPGEFALSHVAKRKVTVYNDSGAKRKPLVTLNQGGKLMLIEKRAVVVNKKSTDWAKVMTDTRVIGWLPFAELLEVQ